MRILLFGASGMVGQAVLLAALAADDVDEVVSVGRTRLGVDHPKLRERLHRDLFDVPAVCAKLAGFDACCFCLGVSVSGLSEAEYTRMTHDLTVGIAEALLPANPRMCFIYVSGAGTDASERGRTMWARVKGRTENALLRMGFRAAAMLRPGIIQPQDGIRSKTPLYQTFYTLSRPFLPLLRRLAPKTILTTRVMGAAILELARHAEGPIVLESGDILAASRR